MRAQASDPAGVEQEGDLAGEASGPAPALELLVDPAVSRAKFERELADYRRMDREYIRRGWLMVRAEFPEVVVVLAAPQLKPSGIVLGVRLDFTNYDLWPPSVTFVQPFTLEPLQPEQVIPILKRQALVHVAEAGQPMALQFFPGHVVPVQMGGHPEQAGPPMQAPAEQQLGDAMGGMMMFPRPPQNLVQAHAGGSPFLCVAGVREYHLHPFHSNDPWLAHRGSGVGTLYHVLDIIHRHGVAPLQEWGVQIQVQAQIGDPLVDFSRVPE